MVKVSVVVFEYGAAFARPFQVPPVSADFAIQDSRYWRPAYGDAEIRGSAGKRRGVCGLGHKRRRVADNVGEGGISRAVVRANAVRVLLAGDYRCIDICDDTSAYGRDLDKPGPIIVSLDNKSGLVKGVICPSQRHAWAALRDAAGSKQNKMTERTCAPIRCRPNEGLVVQSNYMLIKQFHSAGLNQQK